MRMLFRWFENKAIQRVEDAWSVRFGIGPGHFGPQEEMSLSRRECAKILGLGRWKFSPQILAIA